jgi:hypothetical protein
MHHRSLTKAPSNFLRNCALKGGAAGPALLRKRWGQKGCGHLALKFDRFCVSEIFISAENFLEDAEFDGLVI